MRLEIPLDKTYLIKKRKKRDATIDLIMRRFTQRGNRDYHSKEMFLLDVIEDIQNFND